MSFESCTAVKRQKLEDDQISEQMFDDDSFNRDDFQTQINRMITPATSDGQLWIPNKLSFGKMEFVTTCSHCDQIFMPCVESTFSASDFNANISETMMNALVTESSNKEVACNMISASTSTTDLKTTGTDESADLLLISLYEQTKIINETLSSLHQQSLEQMTLANELKEAFDVASKKTK